MPQRSCMTKKQLAALLDVVVDLIKADPSNDDARSRFNAENRLGYSRPALFKLLTVEGEE